MIEDKIDELRKMAECIECYLGVVDVYLDYFRDARVFIRTLLLIAD